MFYLSPQIKNNNFKIEGIIELGLNSGRIRLEDGWLDKDQIQLAARLGSNFA